jgi:hypothetical protein
MVTGPIGSFRLEACHSMQEFRIALGYLTTFIIITQQAVVEYAVLHSSVLLSVDTIEAYAD